MKNLVEMLSGDGGVPSLKQVLGTLWSDLVLQPFQGSIHETPCHRLKIPVRKSTEERDFVDLSLMKTIVQLPHWQLGLRRELVIKQ